DAAALRGVHDEPLTLLDGAGDGVARDGAAARGELHRHALGAADGHAGRRPALAHAFGVLYQLPRDHGRQALAEAEVGEDLALRASAGVAHHALPARVVDLGERGAEGLERLVEEALAERRGLLVLHGLQEVPDVRARLAGAHVLQPSRVRLGVARGDDLDAVAVAKLAAQRH